MPDVNVTPTDSAADAVATSPTESSEGLFDGVQPDGDKPADISGVIPDVGEDGKEVDSAAPELSLEDYKEMELPKGAVAPEGFLDTFKGFALENKLSPEQASAVLKNQLDMNTQVRTETIDEIKGQLEEQKAEWINAQKSDSNFKAIKADARRAITFVQNNPHFDAFKEIMEKTNLGYHPAFVSILGEFGKGLGEPAIISGKPGSPNAESRSAAATLFPDHVPGN